MIPEFVRRRIAAIVEGYAWLWRVAHTHARSPITGTLRFLACALEDVALLGVWCVTTPFTRPVQPDRIAAPVLALLMVVMLPLHAPDASRAAPVSIGSVPEHVGSACGGGLTLGAIASPGDELLAFEACADAFASLQGDCFECGLEPTPRGFQLPAHSRPELSI